MTPVAKHPLFREAAPETLAGLARRLHHRSSPRGSLIFGKGDQSADIFGILKGAIRISATGADGREAIFAVMREGDVFGEIAALDGGPRSADAWAITDCELTVLNRADYWELLRLDAQLAINAITLVCGKLRRTTEQAENIMTLNAGPRIARALLRLADRGELSGANTLTQKDIANLVGVTREITNKYLSRWRSSEWIALERGKISILNRNALENFLD
jgi:CRP-like cAMP-binding protein